MLYAIWKYEIVLKLLKQLLDKFEPVVMSYVQLLSLNKTVKNF